MDRQRIVVLHESTNLYFGEGLVLTELDDAVAFESLEAARRFLDVHGNEPCLLPVPAASSVDDAA
jgi:hypothetical protein